MTDRSIQLFTKKLMHWHEHLNTRTLPWKGERNAYKIWLSEIILQQTRAAQGLPYYLRFITAYPDIRALAAAEDEAVFRLWQGLGYYNRCKNMLAAARHIVSTYDGQFPNTYAEIIDLKGVGAYTAAAIASFAYDLPYAVIDGNVNRVLARYFAIETPIDSTEGKKAIQHYADAALYQENSATYNQAIMDFGATICTPDNPQCTICSLKANCKSFKLNLVNLLPIKSKKIVVKKRFFHYLQIFSNGKMWVKKRTNKDIWQNLYEPFLIEADSSLNVEDFLSNEKYKSLSINILPVDDGEHSQRLTHQIIETRFFTLNIQDFEIKLPLDGEWLLLQDLKKVAFPKTLIAHFQKKFYF